jgi:hypothetical protein
LESIGTLKWTPSVGPPGPALNWILGRSALLDLIKLQIVAAAVAAVDMWGNAPALSKRSVMSTAKVSNAPLMPSRQTAIGVRLPSAWCGRLPF